MRATQDFAQPHREEIPKRYERGRRCKKAGCRTILNPYNGGERCYVHSSRVREVDELERLRALRNA